MDVAMTSISLLMDVDTMLVSMEHLPFTSMIWTLVTGDFPYVPTSSPYIFHIFSMIFPALKLHGFSSIGIPGSSHGISHDQLAPLAPFGGQPGARSCRSSSSCNSWAFYKICWAPGVPWTNNLDHGAMESPPHFDVCFLEMFFHTWWFQMIFRLKGREKCGEIKYGYSMIMHDDYGFLGSQTWRFSALVQGEASLESVWIRRIWPPIMALTSHCFLTSEPLGLQKTE